MRGLLDLSTVYIPQVFSLLPQSKTCWGLCLQKFVDASFKVEGSYNGLADQERSSLRCFKTSVSFIFGTH